MSWWQKLFGVKKMPAAKIDWLEVEGRIRQIEELLRQNSQLAFKQAIIDYDKVIDGVMRFITSGQTFAERLKALRPQFSRETYDQLWRAHLKRNELVHDQGSFVADWELTAHLRAYREAVSALRSISLK